MPLYQVIVLAIVQSLTEFLPISSTAHLALVPWLFGWTDPGLSFDIALHVGTLAAVIIYFFRDWVQLLAQGFGFRRHGDPELARNPRLLWLLALGTVPVGVTGLLFNEQAETTWRSPYVIGTMLIVIAGFMYLAERAAPRKKGVGSISLTDALLIGISQALSIVPGTSRSGVTIATALFRGLDRESAARFSFLLSTPALTAAAFKAFWDLHQAGGITPDMQMSFLVGVVASGITGFAVIALFLRFLRRNTLRFFVYYRIVFGIIVLALAIL
jgi:undecaprenyl-diphosphatase